MKDIKGFEGLYAITEEGQVWSYRSKRFLTNTLDKITGYWGVNLTVNYKSYRFNIHRLLAEAFIPNPENKPTVDHIDRNRQNNSLSNLRWATAKEQELNKDQEERQEQLKRWRKAALKYAKESRKPIQQRDIENHEIIIAEYECAADAAKAIGKNSNAQFKIKAVCRGDKERKSAYGYYWTFKK